MARIFKRGKIWYLDVTVKGHRIRKRVGTSKSVAELALKDAEVKMARDEFDFTRQDITVDDLIERFLEYNRTNHRASTVRRYKSVTDHFKRYLKEARKSVRMVSQLTPEVIEGFKAFRRVEWVNPNGRKVASKDEVKRHTRKGARARTVNIELEGIKTMLTLAVKWDYLKENPLKHVKPLKTDDKKPVRFLTVQECERLLGATPPKLYPVYFTFINTGMRKSELEYLQWGDVDFKRKTIKIHAKENWKPKTNDREIPMSEDVASVLADVKKASKSNDKEDYVFSIKQLRTSPNWLRTELIKLARKAGIPDLTKVHTLRHTFASHLVMAGVDLPTVGKLMGHSDIETTMIYAHLAPEHLASALTKLPVKRR